MKKIDSENMVLELSEDILTERIKFCDRFEFISDDLRDNFLGKLNIPIEKYKTKNFYYNCETKLHISESGRGYMWISNLGLVADRESLNFYDNKFVRATKYQYIVVTMLLESSIALCKIENTYNIESYSYGRLCEMTPTLFNNLLFFFEVFCKSYLSLNGIKPSYTHNLDEIYLEVKNTMFSKNQNNTFFNMIILHPICELIEYVKTIPGGFKEQYVKYDDNSDDSTIIEFDPVWLNSTNNIIHFCWDFISEFCLEGLKSHYLESGQLNRILSFPENKGKEEILREKYSFLVNQ